MLKVVVEPYRLRFRSRRADYDWLDDALWEALEHPRRIDSVLTFFGLEEAILIDAVARLLLKGILLVDPNSGTLHRTMERPAPALLGAQVVDVWQDCQTGIIVSSFEVQSDAELAEPNRGERDTLVEFSLSEGMERPLWPRVLELSDAELYAALPRDSRPPDDRGVSIERERQEALVLQVPVWRMPSGELAFANSVPTELRAAWRRRAVAGAIGDGMIPEAVSWNVQRARFPSWNQIVGAWGNAVGEWIAEASGNAQGDPDDPLKGEPPLASALVGVWLDRMQCDGGKADLAQVLASVAQARRSVVLRWAIRSELCELVAATPSGVQLVIFGGDEEEWPADNRWLVCVPLPKATLARLPQCFALVDSLELWRVGEALVDWPTGRGPGYVRLKSRRTLDRIVESLREYCAEA